MHERNGPNVDEWYFVTHPSAHVGSAHAETHVMVSVHDGSALHALSSDAHDASTHAVHGSLVSSGPRPVSTPVSIGSPESNDVDESACAPESSSGAPVSSCDPVSCDGPASGPGPVS
jgi:hypothetical protein